MSAPKRRNPTGTHVLLCCLAVFICNGCSVWNWGKLDKFPKYDAELAKTSPLLTNIGIAPSNFLLREVRSNLTLPVPELTSRVERDLDAAIEQVLREDGINATLLALDDAALDSDPELRRELYEQSIARAEALRAASDFERVIDVPYPASVDYLCDRLGTDFILFIEGAGWFSPPSQREESGVGVVMLFLFPESAVQIYAGTTLSAFVVDGNHGKVIWYNRVDMTNADPRRPRNLRLVCRDLLRPLFEDADKPRLDPVDASRNEMAAVGKSR